jgi:hypothetical protein
MACGLGILFQVFPRVAARLLKEDPVKITPELSDPFPSLNNRQRLTVNSSQPKATMTT